MLAWADLKSPNFNNPLDSLRNDNGNSPMHDPIKQKPHINMGNRIDESRRGSRFPCTNRKESKRVRIRKCWLMQIHDAHGDSRTFEGLRNPNGDCRSPRCTLNVSQGLLDWIFLFYFYTLVRRLPAPPPPLYTYKDGPRSPPRKQSEKTFFCYTISKKMYCNSSFTIRWDKKIVRRRNYDLYRYWKIQFFFYLKKDNQ